MIDDEIKICDFSGNVYSKDEFINLVKEYNNEGFNFYIGTDSQVFEKHISIVTAICPRRISPGGAGTSGRLFYIKDKFDKNKCPTLRSRMLLEAYRSIETAMDLDPLVDNKISIHLDVGATKKSATSQYEQELQFLVKAQGFDCAIKPDSWAAGGVADRYSKS